MNDLKLSQTAIQSAAICQNCFIKFNEIDEQQFLINKTQNELQKVFSTDTKDERKGEKKIVKPLKKQIVETITKAKEESSDDDFFPQDDFHCDFSEPEESDCDVKVAKFEINSSPKKVDSKMKTKEKKKIVKKSHSVQEKNQNDLNVNRCSRCDQVFDSLEELKEHKETHKSDGGYNCVDCGDS